MLSVRRLSAGRRDYYLDLAREDYYTKGGEPLGNWTGEGSKHLGLEGTVERDAFCNLFRGYSPDGSIPLVKMFHREGQADHHPGWDFCFSAPKTFSVLWSQSAPPLRSQLEEAQRRAVEAAIAYLEKEAAFIRKGSGGHVFEKASLVAAAFEHSTSRAGDPDFHTHLLIMNIGIGEDGKIGTLSGGHLFGPNLKMAAGALYRAELAAQLERLGIRVERTKTWFDLTGVSKALADHFSKRRQEIEDELIRTGTSGAVASATAALKTRATKQLFVREKLFAEWREVGEAFGWSEEQARSLFGHFWQTQHKVEEIGDALQAAKIRLTADNAHFSERDFVRALAEEAPGRGMDASTVLEAAKEHLHKSPDIVRLGKKGGTERFTTHEMYELEQDVLNVGQKLFESSSHQVNVETVMRVLAQQEDLFDEKGSRRENLSEEQLKAVWHLTMEPNGLSIVSGYAGSGKTTLLRVAREIWEAEGIKVIGTALSGRAQQEMTTESGIPSTTIAKILYDLDQGKDPIPRGGIVVLDEAGMVASRPWLRLSAACERAGAKLCAIGHEKQLQPIGPGAPFAEFGSRFGQAVLVRNQRQKEDWAKKAVKEIADGQAKSALDAYVSRGLVSVHDTRLDAISSLIGKWKGDGMDTRNSLIMAGTLVEVGKLNRIAQNEMRYAGRLSEHGISLGPTEFFVGDAVMFTKRSMMRGVENGDRGTITKIDERNRRVSVDLLSGRKVTVSLNDFPHLDLAYAMTVHKAQGASTNKSYVLAGGVMQCREFSYVQASRARHDTSFFVTPSDDSEAIESLRKQMQRSRQKDMAVSVERENQMQRQQEEHSFDR